MKQIEEGCLAIVVNSQAGNNGTCVTVGKYLGTVLPWEDDDRWETDIRLKSILISTGEPVPGCRHCSQSRLLRIDSYEGEPEEETAAELEEVEA